MPKKNHNAVLADEIVSRELSSGITRVVTRLMKEAGYDITRLADAMGVSRVRLSQVLNSKDGKNLWRLPHLVALSRVLGIPVADLVRAGSPDGEWILEELSERVVASVPFGSPEFLRRQILRLMSLYYLLEGMEEDPGSCDYETLYRCTPLEIEQGSPDFWRAYSSCEMKESELVSTIWAALNYAEHNGGLRKIPFWVAMKASYKAK